MSRCVRMEVIVYMFLPAWGSSCTRVPSGMVDCWRAYPAGTLVPGPFSAGLSFLGCLPVPAPGPGFGVSLGCLGWRRPLLAFPPALPGLQIPCPNAQSLCPVPSATSQPSCLHSSLCSSGLSKTSDQAYIEFESIEAIVKTASRTKFFIEFYSTCLEGLRRGPGLGVGHGGWEA